MSKIIIELNLNMGDDEGNEGSKDDTQQSALDLVDKYSDPIRFRKMLLTFSKEQLQNLLKGLEDLELYEYCQIVVDRIKEVSYDSE